MSMVIILTVAGTSLIQSIFGVGVLLFGTPVLMVMGHDFINTIIILLPISLTINLFQIIKGYKIIDTVLYRKIATFTIPFVVLFLFIVTNFSVNIGLFVGIALLIIATKDYFFQLSYVNKSLVKHENLYLVATGILHGTTNLGGILLTAIVHSKKYKKDITRATVAASYATFAIFQIATLLLSTNSPNINWEEISLYLIIGIVVFIFTEAVVYAEIDSKMYTKLFSLFLFSSGLLLCFKSL